MESMEIFHALGLGELILLKWPLRAIYRFNVVAVKLSMTYFYRTGTNNCRICWNYW